MIKTSKSQDSQKVYEHKLCPHICHNLYTCQTLVTLLFTKYSETQLPVGITT